MQMPAPQESARTAKLSAGHRLEPRVEICLNAVRGQARRRSPGQSARCRCGCRSRWQRARGRPVAFRYVGNGLRGAADDVDVHAVGARAEDAAQTAGAERSARSRRRLSMASAIVRHRRQARLRRLASSERLRDSHSETRSGIGPWNCLLIVHSVQVVLQENRPMQVHAAGCAVGSEIQGARGDALAGLAVKEHDLVSGDGERGPRCRW